ncbi:MAG TPA: hypothetical protein VLI05_04150 [Candidatus Saccharimonadia bacterium]|nr:hypothetical protein [Candidatus Saccharimonadia bacterium]
MQLADLKLSPEVIRLIQYKKRLRPEQRQQLGAALRVIYEGNKGLSVERLARAIGRPKGTVQGWLELAGTQFRVRATIATGADRLSLAQELRQKFLADKCRNIYALSLEYGISCNLVRALLLETGLLIKAGLEGKRRQALLVRVPLLLEQGYTHAQVMRECHISRVQLKSLLLEIEQSADEVKLDQTAQEPAR